MLGSNCSDCSNNIRFLLVKTDPLQATVTEWQRMNGSKTYAVLLPEKDSLIYRLNYLMGESVVLAKMDDRQCIKGPDCLDRNFADTIESKIGQKNKSTMYFK